MLTEFKLLDEVKNVATQVIYLSKSVENSSDQLKLLNKNIKEAADSSDKSSRAMKYLTYALVFLGLAQVIVAGLNYSTEKNIIETKKNCYENVLQTSNIDLNYKSCLRSKGLSD